MENSALNYVNKPPLEAWNVWIWRICAAISGILSGISLLHPLFAWLAWLAPAGFLFSMLLDPHKPLREYLWRAALFAGCYYGVALAGLLQVADHINLPRWQAGLLVLGLTALCVLGLSLLWLAAALIFGFAKPPVPVSFGFWPLTCYLIEWLQGHLFGGFPAISLGSSQGAYPLLCQSAACWGALGLSALLILINVLLAAAFLCRRWRYLLLAVAIFIVNIISGLVDWHFQSQPTQTLSVAAAHADVALSDRWDGSFDADIFAIIAGQAAAAQAEGVQLMLLPETILPYTLQASDGYGAQYLQLAAKHQLTIVAGGFAEHPAGTYNSLFSAQGGKLTEIYQKRALVPFGEYIPLQGLLDKLLPQSFWESFPVGRLQAGPQQGGAAINLPNGRRLITAPMICYDVCFAAYPRQAVQDGAQLLLAASNDVWYRGTTLTYQHLNHSVMRAVEYGVPLVNSTNGGISAIIDNQGRILARSINNRAAVAEIGLSPTLTLFARSGQYQVFPIALVWLALTIIGWLCRPASNYKIYSLR